MLVDVCFILHCSRNSHRRFENQTNGYSQSLQRDPMRHMENGNGYNERNAYLTDDQQIMLRTMMEQDREGRKVKRTKSFWKFGRSASDDILEGMALWKHRDLVDLFPEYKRRLQENGLNVPMEYKMQRPSVIENNDSTLKRNMAKMTIEDKTLDRFEKHGIQKSKSTSSINPNTNKTEHPMTNGISHNGDIPKNRTPKQTQQQRMEEEYNSRNDRQSNNSDLTNTSTIKTNFENSFYDDENGEGLVVKTVKRKEILQQYDNESISGSETEHHSIASSTDPYDCIIVDDHMTLRKQREMENRRMQAQQAQYNVKSQEKSRGKQMYHSEISDSDNNGPIKPHLRATLSSERQKITTKTQPEPTPQRVSTFKTFKDNESDMKMYSDSNETLKYSDHNKKEEKYYQNHETDSKKAAKSKKYYSDQKPQESHKRHYNEMNGRNGNSGSNNAIYYSEQSDDYKYNEGSEQQKPQLLPRTKLLKAPTVGPTMQTVMKFEQEIGMMEYRSPPRDKVKGGEQHDFLSSPGHTYGPWFDLWGRDHSVRK